MLANVRRYLLWPGIIVLAAICLGYGARTIGRTGSDHRWSQASFVELQEETARNPENAVAQYYLAYQWRQHGNDAEAFTILQKLAKQEPHEERYWLGLGLEASAMGRALDAANAYKQVCAMDSQAAMPHANLALVYSAAHLPTDAIREFEEAARRDPNRPSLTAWAQSLADQGRYAEAWDKLHTLLTWVPVQDEAYPLLIDLSFRLGRAAEAEKMLWFRLKQAPPQYPTGLARTCLARVLLHETHDAATLKAVENLTTVAVKDSRVEPGFYAVMAQGRMLRGDLPGARSALQKGLKLKADDPECLQLLADVLEKQGDRSQATRLRARVTAMTAVDPQVVALRQAVAAAPENTTTRMALAQALQKSGDPAAAVEACYAILQRTPGDQAAQELQNTCRQEALQKLQKAGEARAKIIPAL